MKRHVITPRPNWTDQADAVGFTYHTFGNCPEDALSGVYWDESICYELTAAEVDTIETATEASHKICLEAVDAVINGYIPYPGGRHKIMSDLFGIPTAYHDYIRESWKRRDPYLYGRFDMAFDGKSEPKILEYNADTPTTLIETAVFQWAWMEQVFPDHDQFNSLHDKIIARMKEVLPKGKMHFASMYDFEEEYRTVDYLCTLAEEAGIDANSINIPLIGWDGKEFVDENYLPISHLYKLYPWEWMINSETDPFAEYLLKTSMKIVEPAWKMLLSNKAILPILYHMYPNHPNVLPAWFDVRDAKGDFIEKPVFGREGANMKIVRNGQTEIKTEGSYNKNRMIYQEAVKLPDFEGNKAVIGSWIVGEQAAGVIFREDVSPIITNTSRIVPHFFVP